MISGELELIEMIRRQAAWAGSGSRAVRLGIGDDCAVLRPSPGHEICVTTDFTLEGRHFRRAWHPPESVGHRCLARGLSDLAAMGAEPLAVLLSLAVPARLPAAWIERFMKGFLSLARRYRVPLAGGDTAESPAMARGRDGLIAIDIVAVGQVPRSQALLRLSTRPGDRIYVTGALGGAAAELGALEKSPRKFAKLTRAVGGHPHFYPEPRLAVGHRLRALAHAMIDISDGLSTDLAHVCQESRVAATIDETALPIHPLAMESRDPLGLALNGGEEYELLFTAPASMHIPRRIAGVPIHRIGTMRRSSRGQPMIVLNTHGGRQIPIKPGGWEHFREIEPRSYRKSAERI
ncbi:MAG: thiamine-phosphate kinase [Acidobacteriaceae bacterium]